MVGIVLFLQDEFKLLFIFRFGTALIREWLRNTMSENEGSDI